MSAQPSPRNILQELLDGIANRRWVELHRLYAEDALVEYPFALPAPFRLQGREAIRQYFATLSTLPFAMRPRDIVMHETNDAEVVVVQWNYDVDVKTTGRSFEVANIQVSTVRHGKIIASRDYHNHFAMAEGFGRLEALLSSFSTRRE